MTVEFCEHLDDYGVMYVRAEASCRALLAQVDRLASGARDEDSLDLTERLLGDWQAEVRALRKRMVSLVRDGRIDLPETEPQGEAAPAPASCAMCGSLVPRLEFTDLANLLPSSGAAAADPANEPEPLAVP